MTCSDIKTLFLKLLSSCLMRGKILRHYFVFEFLVSLFIALNNSDDCVMINNLLNNTFFIARQSQQTQTHENQTTITVSSQID